jgi:phosphate transport system substrate-binding protein
MTRRYLLALGLLIALVAVPVLAQGTNVDPQLHSYQKASGVSGSFKSVGSDTMNNLMALWAEGFRKHVPQLRAGDRGQGLLDRPPRAHQRRLQLRSR